MRNQGKKTRMTEEQAAVVDAVRSGEELVVVQAYAGSGKTHTLTEVARAAVAQGKDVLYLVFNRSMRDEAKQKFKQAGLPGVKVLTAHQLARRNTIGRLKKKIADHPYQLYPAVRREIPWTRRCSDAAAALVAGLVGFAHSPDRAPTLEHVPLERRVQLLRCGLEREEVEEALSRLWRRIVDPGSRFFLLHDFYLKYFHLSGGEVPYDVILYDEAQDANAPMGETVLRQPAQKVFVGDAYQSIYGWRGAVNALERLGGRRLYLSRTFRFGPEIAAPANRVLALLGEKVLMRANPALPGRVRVGATPSGSRVAALVRSNAEAVEALRALRAAGHRVIRFVRDPKFLEPLTEVVHLRLGLPLRKGSPLQGFTWRTLRRAVERDPAGYGELRTLVRLVDRGALLRDLERAVRVKPSEADAVVSTVHQAKGLEWDRVWIQSGFRLTDEQGRPNRAELMLLYVALTRARLELFLPADLEAGLRALGGGGRLLQGRVIRLAVYCDAGEDRVFSRVGSFPGGPSQQIPKFAVVGLFFELCSFKLGLQFSKNGLFFKETAFNTLVVAVRSVLPLTL